MSSSRRRTRKTGGDDVETCFNTFAKRGKLETLEDVGTVIRALGKNPTNAEVEEIVEKNGGIGRGVDLATFKTIYNSKMPKPEDQLDKMESAFQALDRDGSGTLREGELRQVLQNVGEPVAPQQVDMLMRRLNPGPSGEIAYSKILDLLVHGD
mmetsp:Transcript_13745/g.20727  ORF Transcript_13745/g.20727 Transcript_13745/m.20727 type:complete len:153 (+) Transcript_13745:42-500(+)|eukprot:CAMPEP_0201544098 /NCGR_PEP_ID=MMETSP0173_2-20130828/587_1 /ASSEMBLY_ACC=CAM_ASM_000268 /TAXON_ID=218659 /ORGANISM="Vexillifera sp., Strain DIVA3 564/2" /LENGTH=152 /DNA_ID=CAMNT_0047952107 /DNA_START=35 /DNA_END=493 /DNA_ORIENTATION=-